MKKNHPQPYEIMKLTEQQSDLEFCLTKWTSRNVLRAYISLLQNDALWDVCLIDFAICAIYIFFN